MPLCKSPIFIKAADGLVPCGGCFPCRLSHARKWTFRLMMEAMLHERTFWTTLTYATDKLPRSYFDPATGQLFEDPLGSEKWSTLDPRDLQLFIKRVIRYLPPKTFRYFAGAEYGEENGRPHYHLCIFGYGPEILPLLKKCWSNPHTKEPLGFVDERFCRPLDAQNMRYTCGYTLNKLHCADANKARLGGRVPEFTSHSKGIGLAFCSRFASALRTKSGDVYFETFQDIPRAVRHDGKWWPLDRYMREKILEELQVTNPAKEAGKIRFAKEMRSLSLRAELNPKFSAASIVSPYVLECQYLEENAQQILNTEKRAKLKPKGNSV